MCGIAGIITADTSSLNLASLVDQMQAELMHRGPDDRGLFVSVDRRCALAHTRLSILDLSSAGHQPMSSTDGRYSIVFNGEIYNYRELREELGGGRVDSVGASNALTRNVTNATNAGQKPAVSNVEWSELRKQETPQTGGTNTWNSNSDTEVILRAYTKWGRDCVNHLRGMFAFVIWDEQRQELFLARDPFGIKPLYYYQIDRMFVFASEVRALLASGLVPRKLSQAGLQSFLQFGSVQNPLTMVDGVNSLLPGHCLVVQRSSSHLEVNQFSFHNYLTLNLLTSDGAYGGSLSPYPLPLSDPPSTRAEAVKQLSKILEDSVRLHLVSDVPLGAFLSGGIDSSAIVALMSRVAGQRLKTFSVVFEESEFSEGEHAKLVARKFGTEHHEILLSEQTLLEMLPGALAAMDQPTMDGINTYVISKEVKEAGVTVALSGLGGDELFAGYPSFRRALQLHKIARLPQPLRISASAVGHVLFNGSVRNRKFWDMFESDCSPYAAYTISRQLFSPTEIAEFVRDGVRCTNVTNAVDSINAMNNSKFEIRNAKCEIETDLVNSLSRYELTGYMVNTLLRDTDQMSMVHALEVRVPFVDSKVVQYVMGLPGAWKTDGRHAKPLLVDALANLLPEKVWKRPKMGFTLPFERWMRSALESEIDDTVSVGNGLANVGINCGLGRGVWRAFRENSRHEGWSRPWALYVLKKWCDLNNVGL